MTMTVRRRWWRWSTTTRPSRRRGWRQAKGWVRGVLREDGEADGSDWTDGGGDGEIDEDLMMVAAMLSREGRRWGDRDDNAGEEEVVEVDDNDKIDSVDKI
jgi:hypothetical protein